ETGPGRDRRAGFPALCALCRGRRHPGRLRLPRPVTTGTRPPVAFVVLAGAAALFFALPLLGLVARPPWAGAGHGLGAPPTLEALRLSRVCSLGASAASLALGLPLAWVNARIRYPGRDLLRALTTLPMVLPPVVGGVALLLAFGRRGLA